MTSLGSQLRTFRQNKTKDVDIKAPLQTALQLTSTSPTALKKSGSHTGRNHASKDRKSKPGKEI